MRREFATKKDVFEMKEDFKRYVGALSEEFQSRLSGVAEIVTANREDIVSMRNELEHHNKRFDYVDNQLYAIRLDLNNKADKRDFLKLEKRVTKLERKSV